MCSLSAYVEKFPGAGRFNDKKADVRVCEKLARATRGMLLARRPVHLSRFPRLARERDKTATAEQRAEAAKKRPAELEEEVAELRRMVHTGGTPL